MLNSITETVSLAPIWGFGGRNKSYNQSQTTLFMVRFKYFVKKRHHIVDSRGEPGIKQPEGVRSIRNSMYFGIDFILIQHIYHFISSGMKAGLGTTDKKYGN